MAELRVKIIEGTLKVHGKYYIKGEIVKLNRDEAKQLQALNIVTIIKNNIKEEPVKEEPIEEEPVEEEPVEEETVEEEPVEEEPVEEEPVEEESELMRIKGIGKELANALNNIEIYTIKEFLNAEDEELALLPGITLKNIVGLKAWALKAIS